MESVKKKERDSVFLTPFDSKKMYGVAILLMLFHHLFCIPERLNNNFISVFPPDTQFAMLEVKIAWLCKMCVGIYAFITGYGMFIRMDQARNKYNAANPLLNLFYGYKKSLKSLLSLFERYWLVFAVFVPMGFIFFGREFETKEFFMNLFGLSRTYNGEWWYVFQYIIFMLMFPVIDTIFSSMTLNRYTKWLVKGGIVYLLIAFLYGFPNTVMWVRNIYNFLGRDFNGDVVGNEYVATKNDIINFFVSAAAFCTAVYLRFKYADAPGWSAYDPLIIPLFVYGVTGITKCRLFPNVINKVLGFFGKYSTYMWLVHTFFAYYYFQWLVVLPRYTYLIYVWLVILSLATAVILDLIFKGICKLCSLIAGAIGGKNETVIHDT